MNFDLFYTGPKPNLFVYEKPANSLTDAKQNTMTHYCWYINGINDYTSFDFNFKPIKNRNYAWFDQNGKLSTILANKLDTSELFEIMPNVVYKKYFSNKKIYFITNKQCELPDSIKPWDHIEVVVNVNNSLTFLDSILLSEKESFWLVDQNADVQHFDFSWLPPANRETWLTVFVNSNNMPTGIFYIETKQIKNYIKNFSLVTNTEVKSDVDFLFYNSANNKTNTNLYNLLLNTQRIYANNTLSNPYDVIFVSNGEPEQEILYSKLCSLLSKKPKRIKDINGRTEALRAAAQLSETEWFFCVPAKLEINPSFPWGYAASLFKEKKHYIFTATNAGNALEYGHMAMVAYNKELALETVDAGLDFTMSKPHSVVPINSGIAKLNIDALTAWRTAFREVIKLRLDKYRPNLIYKDLVNHYTNYRLEIWKSQATGPNAEWILQGAKDALEYYYRYEGNYFYLQKTYDWKWIAQYIKIKGYNFNDS